MAINVIKIGEFGQLFRIKALNPDGSSIDVSGATAYAINFYDPVAKTTTVKTATLSSGTTDQFEYTRESGFIANAGYWFIEGEWTTAGVVNKTLSGRFKVVAING